ncbi:MAG: arginine--tRNA ligase [Clostridiales bacterium]|nr:arginine--tRNA ligase [Clostridiales bacterium]
MSNPINSSILEIEGIITTAVERLMENGDLPQIDLPEFKVEIPNDRTHGDFAVNIAMICAREFKMAPRKIAEMIIATADLDGSNFDKIDVAGPGFINLTLNPRWFGEVIATVIENGREYGKTNLGQGKRVLVEFVSANPTGPMHIGNARGGAMGDCLAGVLSLAGYDVDREFYINDAGNQIERFATSLEVRYLQIYKGDSIQMPEDAYMGDDIKEHAQNFSKQFGDKFVESDSETRRNALIEYALPININQLQEHLRKYRIEYDCWFKESILHENGEVDRVIKLLKEKGYTYEKEDALWFKATEFGLDKDYVLVRSNGLVTYVVPDIAYHYNKLVVRGYDKAINILGADHHGYSARLKAAIKALGIDDNRLDIVLMQMVRLMRDGELVKASKRTGKSITLSTLLEEVPIDAARFFFNMREANTHFDFDLGLAVEESSNNPVYYVQYAHARICSIISALDSEGIKARELSPSQLSILTMEEERELIRHIAMLPSEVDESAKAYDPSRITRYLLELATLFHKFYTACRVKVDDEDLMSARLQLIVATRAVIENLLTMMKIDAPESM